MGSLCSFSGRISLPNTPGAAPVGDDTIFGDEGNHAIAAGLGSDAVEGVPGDDGISGAGGVSAQDFVVPVSGPISSTLPWTGLIC